MRQNLIHIEIKISLYIFSYSLIPILYRVGINSIRRLSFDETCCKLKGVPKECIGNCIDDASTPSSRVMGLPPSMCDDYRKAIERCVVIGKTGIYNDLDILWFLGFYSQENYLRKLLSF